MEKVRVNAIGVLLLCLVTFASAQTGLGYIQAFSLFSHKDINAFDSETQGRIAAGGSVSLQNYNVAQALIRNCSRTDLLVGENLDFIDGEVGRGKITYRGTITLTDVGLGCTAAQSTANLIDFDSIFAELNVTANTFATHIANSFIITTDSTLKFKGVLKTVNYFKISSDSLASATSIIIDVPVNASVVISVIGPSVSINAKGFQLANTTDVQRILWNFYQATVLTIESVELQGSVLAPLADVRFNSGTIRGSVASLAFSGAGVIAYSPYIPPNSNCTCIPCPPLWYLPPYTVYVLEDVTVYNSGDQGRLAAGGNVNITSFSVGTNLRQFSFTTNVTIVGGDLTFVSGAIYGGDAVAAGSITLDEVTVVNGVAKPNTPIDIDFQTQFNNLTRYTLYFSKLPSYGSVELEFSTLTLNSSDSGLNIFTLTSQDFNAATNLIIDCPATSWAVINVPDVNAEIQAVYVQLIGIPENRVIWNCFQATTLLVDSVGVYGSILAPFADVTFTSGNIVGNIVAKSLNGPGFYELNLPIPLQPPCPPCICVADV